MPGSCALFCWSSGKGGATTLGGINSRSGFLRQSSLGKLGFVRRTSKDEWRDRERVRERGRERERERERERKREGGRGREKTEEAESE